MRKKYLIFKTEKKIIIIIIAGTGFINEKNAKLLNYKNIYKTAGQLLCVLVICNFRQKSSNCKM